MADSLNDKLRSLGINQVAVDFANQLAQFQYNQKVNPPIGTPTARFEFTKWVNETFVGGTAVHSGNGTTVVRVPTGSNSFLERVLSTGIIDGDINHAKSMVQSWALMNGIRLKIEEGIEPEKPKKRVRMGKWGIKKEHLRP